MGALRSKYGAKQHKKPENKQKILNIIVSHLNHRDKHTKTDWELIRKFLASNYANPDDFKKAIGDDQFSHLKKYVFGV